MILNEIYKLAKESKTIDGQISQIIIEELLAKRYFVLTVTELSEKSGCSQPSASRFAKNLGVATYKKLVQKINEEAPIYFAPNDQKNDDLLEAKQAILTAVDQTLTNFDNQKIAEIAQLILNSQKINVVAIGGNRTIKQEIEHKLSQVDKHVMLANDWHQEMINLNYMNDKDLVIVISYSGDKDESKKIVNEASQRQIPVLLFSGDFQTSMIKKATYYVKIISQDPKYRSFSFASKPAVMAAWEIIFKKMLLIDKVAEEVIDAWTWTKEYH